MKSDRALWFDQKGRLCDRPPSTGLKLANMAGVEIPPHIAKQYELIVKDGRILQRGKLPLSPKSTPDPLVADRDLWITREGELVDEEPEKGISIARRGDKIPSQYVSEHKLVEKGGKIEQKGAKKPEDKQKKKPANKGSGLKINKGSD